MKNLENLKSSEREMLLKFPAYISLLAASNNDSLDETEKKEAIKFCHIKTFTCDPLLYEFYQEAEKVFQINVMQLDNELPKGKDERDAAIKTELVKLETILQKLGKEYVSTMHRSMKSFKDHVSQAHHSILESFIFPIPIKGLTD